MADTEPTLPADCGAPLKPGENPLADQLIEENDRLRRERNQWIHEAERIKREYDNLVASHDFYCQHNPCLCPSRAALDELTRMAQEDGLYEPEPEPEHIEGRAGDAEGS